MGIRTIEYKSGASGKRAVISGTRVRVSDIARLYSIKLDEIVTEGIVRALPHLSREQVTAALDHWRANREEIDVEIATEDALMEKIPTAW